MKISRLILAATLILSQMSFIDAEARDGDRGGSRGSSRGGDRGGSHGGDRGGHKGRDGGSRSQSIQRSPSMSRATPSTRSSRNDIVRDRSSNDRKGSSGQQFNRPNTYDRGPNKGGGGVRTRDNFKDFLKKHPTTLPSKGPDNKLPNRPDRPDRPDKPGRPDKPDRPDRPDKPGRPDKPDRPDRPDKDKPWNDRDKDRWKDNDRKHYSHRYKDIGRNVRHNYHGHYKNKGKWFNRNFWDHHHYHPPYYSAYNNWWIVPTIGGLGAWLGWQSQPYYYGNFDNLGYSGNYWGPMESNYVYSPPTYYQQSQAIEVASDQSLSTEWMPLGVFAVSKTSDSVASPNMFVQLAVNKEGVISGTFYIATTDQVYELEGFVDPESQRAVWQIADKDDVPVIETGIYNLTEEEVPIRLYYPDGKIEDKLLIRLDDE